MGDWAQNDIGSVYTRLNPIKESHYYAHKEPKDSCVGPILNIPVPMMCDVFPKACVTMNNSNTFHTDKNDRQFVSHSVITTSNTFIQHDKHKHGDFFYLYKCFSLQ